MDKQQKFEVLFSVGCVWIGILFPLVMTEMQASSIRGINYA